MPNQPLTTLCVDREGLANITASFHVYDEDPPIARISLAPGLNLQSYGDANVNDLADTLEKLAADLRAQARAAIRDAWVNAHPVVLDPDDLDDASRRADLHDDGLDGEPLSDHDAAAYYAETGLLPAEVSA